MWKATPDSKGEEAQQCRSVWDNRTVKSRICLFTGSDLAKTYTVRFHIIEVSSNDTRLFGAHIQAIPFRHGWSWEFFLWTGISTCLCRNNWKRNTEHKNRYGESLWEVILFECEEQGYALDIRSCMVRQLLLLKIQGQQSPYDTGTRKNTACTWLLFFSDLFMICRRDETALNRMRYPDSDDR